MSGVRELHLNAKNTSLLEWKQSTQTLLRELLVTTVVAAVVTIGITSWHSESAFWIPASATRHGPSLPEPYMVTLSGSNFKWSARYPGPDRQSGTTDDVYLSEVILLPTKHHLLIELSSEDYVYVLACPELSLNQLVVPGRSQRVVLFSEQEGDFALLPATLCGPAAFVHSASPGTFRFVPQRRFRDTLEGER